MRVYSKLNLHANMCKCYYIHPGRPGIGQGGLEITELTFVYRFFSPSTMRRSGGLHGKMADYYQLVMLMFSSVCVCVSSRLGFSSLGTSSDMMKLGGGWGRLVVSIKYAN